MQVSVKLHGLLRPHHPGPNRSSPLLVETIILLADHKDPKARMVRVEPPLQTARDKATTAEGVEEGKADAEAHLSLTAEGQMHLNSNNSLLVSVRLGLLPAVEEDPDENDE